MMTAQPSLVFRAFKKTFAWARAIPALVLVFLPTFLAAESLVFGYSNSDGAPYYIFRNGHLSSGFFYELGEAIGKELSVEVEFRGYPRNRIERALATGEISAILYENPGWMDHPNDFMWSNPYYSESSLILFSKKSVSSVTSPDDLRGLRIGAILGYHYPELEPYFKNGYLTRDDAPTLDQNIAKLRLNRVDAIIANEKELDWAVDSHDRNLTPSLWTLETHSISLVASPSAGHSPKKLIRAIEALRIDGTIERIWKTYRFQTSGD
jgi:polar amino acid transport system substrate-binding protein